MIIIIIISSSSVMYLSTSRIIVVIISIITNISITIIILTEGLIEAFRAKGGRLRALVVINPGNPIGNVMRREDIDLLARCLNSTSNTQQQINTNKITQLKRT